MSRTLILVFVGILALTGCTTTQTATYSPSDIRAVQEDLFDERVTVHTRDGRTYSGYTLRMDRDSTNWVNDQTGTLHVVATSEIDRIVTGRKALRGSWLGIKRGALVGATAGIVFGVAFGDDLKIPLSDDVTDAESRLLWSLTGVTFGTPIAAGFGGGIGMATGSRIEVEFEEGVPTSTGTRMNSRSDSTRSAPRGSGAGL
jgi:hypothetical protein